MERILSIATTETTCWYDFQSQLLDNIFDRLGAWVRVVVKTLRY